MGWWKDTIEIVKEKDPAARNSLEVLLTYPGVKALAAHRLSHWMWQNGFKLLARMHSQFWRFGPTLKFIQVQKLPRESLLIMARDW